MSVQASQNVDNTEREKFDSIASGWWDPTGPFRPLHELNPARLKFIADRAKLAGAEALDVGCGGGILAESMARKGANVTGIDIAPRVLATAKLHLHESGLEVDYREITVEDMAKAKALCPHGSGSKGTQNRSRDRSRNRIWKGSRKIRQIHLSSLE